MDVLKAKLDLEQVEGAKNDVGSNPVAGGLQQDSFKVSSSPPHSMILWI